LSHVLGDHYVWLIWASAFLVPWLVLFVTFSRYRTTILGASVMTALFGFTEPIFVPAYWDPPSLFNLAQRTGFDIESLIFCFAIGGVGVSVYNILTRRALEPVPSGGDGGRHSYHGASLLVPIVTFPLLMLAPWNPIYPATVALLLGALGTVACRPDLMRNVAFGGVVFVVYYLIFMLGLEWSVPGYIARVWKLGALSGIFLYRVPLEEILFGFVFGAYWAGIYEHLMWRQSAKIGDHSRHRGPSAERLPKKVGGGETPDAHPGV
jgi:hypothetical protein